MNAYRLALDIAGKLRSHDPTQVDVDRLRQVTTNITMMRMGVQDSSDVQLTSDQPVFLMPGVEE